MNFFICVYLNTKDLIISLLITGIFILINQFVLFDGLDRDGNGIPDAEESSIYMNPKVKVTMEPFEGSNKIKSNCKCDCNHKCSDNGILVDDINTQSYLG